VVISRNKTRNYLYWSACRVVFNWACWSGLYLFQWTQASVMYWN